MPRLIILLLGCAIGFVLGGYVDEYLKQEHGNDS